MTVMPAGEEPGGRRGTAADWLPGLRDEHEDDDAGWQARWLDRPTWDRTVTPNVKRRTGRRGPRGADEVRRRHPARWWADGVRRRVVRGTHQMKSFRR